MSLGASRLPEGTHHGATRRPKTPRQEASSGIHPPQAGPRPAHHTHHRSGRSPQAQVPLHQARRRRQEEAHPHPLPRARIPHKVIDAQAPAPPRALNFQRSNLQPTTPQLAPESPAETRAWRDAEILAAQLSLAADSAASRALPLIAICGRPNVGKSTLFNRLTGSRRSIVGDEPGITRDRIYGLIEWQSATARLVDTGGIVPDDPELIPAEIFLQAQTALAEAAVIIMVVDGRTELASPDIALARLLLRGGKPVFLAVNKIDTIALAPAAENFRRLGFRNVLAISAEHGAGIGDLLDAVFAALPAPIPRNSGAPSIGVLPDGWD